MRRTDARPMVGTVTTYIVSNFVAHRRHFVAPGQFRD
jgi:hypothetical protein